ncbi:MAG: hypothetical protein AAFX79_10555 [Planctomycetota bacterium]
MRAWTALAAWCIAVLLGLTIAGCERAASTPSATQSAALRIATTSPAVGVLLRDFGASDLAVGRSGWDVALPSDVAVVGDAAGVDLESLLAAQPTHLYIESSGGPPEAAARLADRAGFEIRTFPLVGLDDLIAIADDVHALVSRDRDAGEPPSARFAEALRPDASLAGAGRVLVLMAGTPPAALGPGSVHQEVLERIGGVAALPEGRAYLPLDAEDVLAIDPDAIVLLDPRERGDPSAAAGDGTRLEAALGILARLPITAIEDGRVALVDDPEVLMASTSTLRYARELRAQLERWRDERLWGAGEPPP